MKIDWDWELIGQIGLFGTLTTVLIGYFIAIQTYDIIYMYIAFIIAILFLLLQVISLIQEIRIKGGNMREYYER